MARADLPSPSLGGLWLPQFCRRPNGSFENTLVKGTTLMPPDDHSTTTSVQPRAVAAGLTLPLCHQRLRGHLACTVAPPLPVKVETHLLSSFYDYASSSPSLVSRADKRSGRAKSSTRGGSGSGFSGSVLLSPPHPLLSLGESPPGVGCGLSRRRFRCKAVAAAAIGAAAGAAMKSWHQNKWEI